MSLATFLHEPFFSPSKVELKFGNNNVVFLSFTLNKYNLKPQVLTQSFTLYMRIGSAEIQKNFHIILPKSTER